MSTLPRRRSNNQQSSSPPSPPLSLSPPSPPSPDGPASLDNSSCKHHLHPTANVGRKRPRITTFAEAPEYLRVPFIHTGYRVGYDLFYCCVSLFQVHNETINIWSHLVGSIILLFLLNIVINGIYFPYMTSVYLICCTYGLMASVIFHWFNCISATHHLYLRILDFGGIAANILGASWPMSYYTFYCHSTSLKIYILILSITSPLMMGMPFISFFHRHMKLRTLIYAVQAGLPAYECLHYIILEGYSTEYFRILYLPTFVAYACFGTGMFLYLTRIPERFWPGAFDLLGTSHQMWHVLVVIGQFVLYTGINGAAEYRHHHLCSA